MGKGQTINDDRPLTYRIPSNSGVFLLDGKEASVGQLSCTAYLPWDGLHRLTAVLRSVYGKDDMPSVVAHVMLSMR